GAGPGGGQLGGDHLVQHGLVRLDTEDGGLQVDGAQLVAGRVPADDGPGHRGRPLPAYGGAGHGRLPFLAGGVLTESRSRTTEPRAPGTAPLTSTSSRSGSADTTSRLRAVTCWPPIRPAMRVPLNTRDGVAQAPMEPGTRWALWFPWEAPCPLKLCRFIPPAKPLPLLTAMASTFSPAVHRSAVSSWPTSYWLMSARRSSTSFRPGSTPARS